MGSEPLANLEEIVALVVERVGNCYEKLGLCCSESISYVLSQAFGSGLSGRDAVQLGAGSCHGMGGAGCSCGALTGSVVILSYYLGPHGPDGLQKEKFQRCIRTMHNQFRERFRSTCCRILSEKVKDETPGSRISCKELTAGGAEIATHLLLEARPGLARRVDLAFLRSRQLSV
ncbi:MAG: C-GCAxxG-C-C family protein [Proteobacteria bacterium]|nr:C-GCAxxG-C-C family protein [Pseudomonadota bacterium]MBU1640804.1 C-GCAxxG-C-C family protein [Pseudomonadota bacterium]